MSAAPLPTRIDLCVLGVLAIVGYAVGRHEALNGRANRIEGWVGPMLAAGVFIVLKRWLWDGRGFPAMLGPMFALGALAVGIRIGSRRVVNHRRRCNLCVTCGYDLCGNVSGVCSECGEPI